MQSYSQSHKKPNGIRYPDLVLNQFSMNSFIMAGRHYYEILRANKPGVFPCPRTIESYIEQFDMSVDEGVVNAQMLLHYLVQHKMPLVVAVSEDATAIVQKREYDGNSNKIRGLALPLQFNWLPNANDANAQTAKDIVSLFENFGGSTVALVSLFLKSH